MNSDFEVWHKAIRWKRLNQLVVENNKQTIKNQMDDGNKKYHKLKLNLLNIRIVAIKKKTLKNN